MANHVNGCECSDHRFLELVDVFFDKVSGAFEVDQRVCDQLSGAVVRHLSAAITGDDGDVADIAHMIRFASEALREYGGVLAKPNLIIGVTLTRIRERTHLAKRLRVINQSQVARVHGSENDLDHRVT